MVLPDQQRQTDRGGHHRECGEGIAHHHCEQRHAQPVCDPELRDTEQVPLLEDGGIEAFIRREVLPYTADAWVKSDATKVGYEISFTRHVYKPKPLRTLEEISADILAIEREAEGLLDGLLVGEARS